MNITLWCLNDHRGNWGILLGHKKDPWIWCHVTSLYGVLTDLSVFTSNAGKNRIGRTNLQFQFGSRDIVPQVKKDKVSRDSWLLVYLRKHAPPRHRQYHAVLLVAVNIDSTRKHRGSLWAFTYLLDIYRDFWRQERFILLASSLCNHCKVDIILVEHSSFSLDVFRRFATHLFSQSLIFLQK